MGRDRPMEIRRARRGLGGRSPEGETFPAKPKGRMTGGKPRLRSVRGPKPVLPSRGRPRGPRVEQARRRTLHDNPEVAD